MLRWLGATFFMICFFICLNIGGCVYFNSQARIIEMENKNLELKIKETELEISKLKSAIIEKMSEKKAEDFIIKEDKK